jgi:hypothetical protein
MAKAPKDAQVNVKMPIWLKATLEEYCGRKGVPAPEVLRQLGEAWARYYNAEGHFDFPATVQPESATGTIFSFECGEEIARKIRLYARIEKTTWQTWILKAVTEEVHRRIGKHAEKKFIREMTDGELQKKHEQTRIKELLKNTPATHVPFVKPNKKAASS